MIDLLAALRERRAVCWTCFHPTHEPGKCLNGECLCYGHPEQS